MPVIPATQEDRVQSQPRANSSQERPYIKKKAITKKGLVQWLKGRVLGSNPSTTKIKRTRPEAGSQL
jgi:hypothetical protein